MQRLEFPQDDVDVGLEQDGSHEVDGGSYIVLAVHHITRVLAKYEGRPRQYHCHLAKWINLSALLPDDEDYSQQGDKHIDDIKGHQRLLEEDPGEDDDPDWRAG